MLRCWLKLLYLAPSSAVGLIGLIGTKEYFSLVTFISPLGFKPSLGIWKERAPQMDRNKTQTRVASFVIRRCFFNTYVSV